MRILFLFVLLLSFSGCKTDLSQQATFSGNQQLQAVIETPAGSSRTFRYNPETQGFETVQEAGQDKVVRFLPYPVNAGFIPSTQVDTSRTGQASPLPVMVISESQPSGTVMEITPLGVLVLEQTGDLIYQVIAVPAKPSEQLLAATDYDTFSAKYPSVKKILEQWLVQAYPNQQIRVMGWKNDKFADELIRKWMK